MAVFEYKAFSGSGKVVKGLIEADSSRVARQKLRTQGIFPTSLIESGEEIVSANRWNPQIRLESHRVSTSTLALITRQLATLVAAGMPLVESLRALTDQIDHAYLKRVISEVGTTVNEGSTLANALKPYPKVFPRLFVNMVSSGEASGSLDLVLERLADLLEAQAILRRKLLSALTYPVLMLFLCVVVIIILLAFVVPQITEIFKDRKVPLPLPTQIVVGASDFAQSYWWLILFALGGIAFGIPAYYRTPAGRERIDTWLLRLPIFGAVNLKICTARFARNLGTMLESGIEVLGALAIAKNIIGNVVLEAIVDKAADGVREGGGLARELDRSKKFPRILIHMIAIGERTGSLDKMLLRAADAFESEVNAFIAGLSSILEPILIVFLATIVGGILASVMLPMLEMTSFAGK